MAKELEDAYFEWADHSDVLYFPKVWNTYNKGRRKDFKEYRDKQENTVGKKRQELMNKKLLIAVFVSAMAHTFACAASPKENRMKTVWADKVTS